MRKMTKILSGVSAAAIVFGSMSSYVAFASAAPTEPNGTVAATPLSGEHEITIIGDLESKASVSHDKAAKDTIVTITINPGAAEELDLNNVQIQYKRGQSLVTAGTLKVDDTTYTFTMPDCEVEVYALRKTYWITYDFDDTMGSVRASHTMVSGGDNIKLTVSPKEGYALDALTVKDADGNTIALGDDNTFTMPRGDVTVTATFERTYMVKIDSNVGNKLIVSHEWAKKDETVTITENLGPEEVVWNYSVKKPYSDYASVEVTDNKDGTYTFIMPDEDVLLSAFFRAKKYDITLTSDGNGLVRIDRIDAPKGDKPTVTVTPKDGYEFDTLTITDADGNTIALDEDNTFTMPGCNVAIHATFKKVTDSSTNDTSKPDDTSKPNETSKPDDTSNTNDTSKPDDISESDDTSKPDDDPNKNPETGIALAVAPIMLVGAITVVLARKNKK